MEVFVRNRGHPDGAFLSVNARPLRDERGAIRGAVAVVHDVTARKLAEEELRKSRERFELAVLASQDGLWDWDVENDQVWYSARTREMLGYDEQEFPNRPGETEKRVHPDDLARWRAVRDDEAAGGADHHEFEYRMRHRDGSYRWLRSRSVALRRADGKVYRIAGSREDITQRKIAEGELAYERYLARSLTETSPDFIYFKDREGRYTHVNPAFFARLGLSDPAQFLGKTDHDLFDAEHARQTQAEEEEIIRTGRPVVSKDVTITWPDGKATWGSVTKMPLRDPQGQLVGTFGITRDITKRKLAEEALRQSEERYRSVVAAMQDGVLILDAGGNAVSCNAAAQRILGQSAEQVMGRSPEDPHWRAVLPDGAPVPGENPAMITLRTGRPCMDNVMGVHKPDGTLTWITVNAQPLFEADGRTLAGVAASFEDITERKRLEEELRQTTERLVCCEQQLQRLAASEGRQVARSDSGGAP